MPETQQHHKLIRITTVPLSLEKLLEGQLGYMAKWFDVTAISSDEERLKKYAENEGVAYFALPLTRSITPLKDLIAIIKLVHFLRKEQPSIVHTHTPKAGMVGMIAAKIAHVPIRLHTVAGLPLMEASGLKRLILNIVEKIIYRCATKVYPNSNGLRDFIIENKFVSTEKLKIIGNGSSNGIDTNFFDPDSISSQQKKILRHSLNIPEEAFIFIFVGRIVGDKGINELVMAFENSEVLENSFLLLVGPYESDLDPINEVAQNIINSNANIKAVGFQLDVRPYFAISDILVFPSYREGFPNVVLQAAAMGLPAIVSNINGCNEIIAHRKNGLLVAPKDVPSLQAAMENLYSNSSLRRDLKEVARKRIKKKFQRKEIWGAILKEYNTLLKQHLGEGSNKTK